MNMAAKIMTAIVLGTIIGVTVHMTTGYLAHMAMQQARSE